MPGTKKASSLATHLHLLYPTCRSSSCSETTKPSRPASPKRRRSGGNETKAPPWQGCSVAEHGAGRRIRSAGAEGETLARLDPSPVIPRFPSGFDPCGEPRREVAFTNLPPGLRRRPAVASTPAPPPPRRRQGLPPRGTCPVEFDGPRRRTGACPSSTHTTRGGAGRTSSPAFQAGLSRRRGSSPSSFRRAEARRRRSRSRRRRRMIRRIARQSRRAYRPPP